MIFRGAIKRAKKSLKMRLIKRGRVFFRKRFGLNETKVCFGENVYANCQYDCTGKNNIIIFERGARMEKCNVFIMGNDNKILIGKNCVLNNTDFWIEDNGGTISIGKETVVAGSLGVSCIEGTAIKIGDNCLFSNGINIQTGDAHSIVDLNGRRINQSADVEIGNHVWVGRNVLFLKGSRISENSIVGACSVVTKAFSEANSVIAGSPAKKVRSNVNWRAKRI